MKQMVCATLIVVASLIASVVSQCTPGCVECTQIACLKCATNFFIRNTVCVRCPANCAGCDNIATCQICDAGYSLSIDGSCFKCNQFCDICSSPTDCINCQAGYYLRGAQGSRTCSEFRNADDDDDDETDGVGIIVGLVILGALLLLLIGVCYFCFGKRPKTTGYLMGDPLIDGTDINNGARLPPTVDNYQFPPPTNMRLQEVQLQPVINGVQKPVAFNYSPPASWGPGPIPAAYQPPAITSPLMSNFMQRSSMGANSGGVVNQLTPRGPPPAFVQPQYAGYNLQSGNNNYHRFI